MGGHRRFQLIEERAPPVANILRGGAVDAMTDLRDCERAENDRDLPHAASDALDRLRRREPAALGGD
jgi:hypothetical protein